MHLSCWDFGVKSVWRFKWNLKTFKGLSKDVHNEVEYWIDLNENSLVVIISYGIFKKCIYR